MPELTTSEADPLYQGGRLSARIDRLGDEIATLSAQIQAATYEVLVRLREFDKLEGWGRSRRQVLRTLARLAHQPRRWRRSPRSRTTKTEC